MPTDHRTSLATCGELLATQHLARRGYEIVATNARTRFGEIDVIARGDEAIIFVEVKTRRSGGGAGSPFDAIDRRKTQQVRKLAAAWLAETPGRPTAEGIRFDAVGVTVDGRGELISLDHLENAF